MAAVQEVEDEEKKEERKQKVKEEEIKVEEENIKVEEVEGSESRGEKEKGVEEEHTGVQEIKRESVREEKEDEHSIYVGCKAIDVQVDIPIGVQCRRVLAVDDAPLNLKMMSRVIQNMFDEVLWADNGQEAVTTVEKLMSEGKSIDLILMDYMMPVMNGPTAARAIRYLGYTGPIIGVTGNATQQDILYFVSEGADSVLTKPFTVEDLQEAIAGTLCLFDYFSRYLLFHFFYIFTPILPQRCFEKSNSW